jgi:hypothetical protein
LDSDPVNKHPELDKLLREEFRTLEDFKLECIIRLRLVMAKLGRRFWWIPQKVETSGFLFGKN